MCFFYARKEWDYGWGGNEIIRSGLNNIIFKEAPPKEFYDLLNKINNIGININQIAHIANSNGGIYFETLKAYFSQIEKFINEVREKFLWYNIIAREGLVNFV